jgi:hypothetical protein
LPLCNGTATATIYVYENVVGVEEEFRKGVSLYPNPGTGKLNVLLENSYTGKVSIQLLSITGVAAATPIDVWKYNSNLDVEVDNALRLQSGVYLVKIKLGEKVVTKKWLKY